MKHIPATISRLCPLLIGGLCLTLSACAPNDAPPTATPSTPVMVATDAPPTILILADMDCAGGPGTEYPRVATLHTGDEVQLFGKDDYGEYWIVIAPDGQGGCWIRRQDGTARGETDYLPNLVAPPTPHLVPAVAPTNFHVLQQACVIRKDLDPVRWFITVELAWEAGQHDADSFYIYRNGVLVADPDWDARRYQDTILLHADKLVEFLYEIRAVRNSGDISESREVTVSSFSCK